MGVATGITAPQTRGFLQGPNTAFSTGEHHKLDTQVAALAPPRSGLTERGREGGFWKDQEGRCPLVVETSASSGDIVASVNVLKAEVEAKLYTSLRFTIIGGSEAHLLRLLARELGVGTVGAIHSPAGPFPKYWEPLLYAW